MNSFWLGRICSPYKKQFYQLAAAMVIGATTFISLPAAAADQWEVKNIGAPINTEYQDGWATITGDGLTLYFGSNRPGGLSPANINDDWYIGQDGTPTRYNTYVSHRKTRTSAWSEPKRLPIGVNSQYSDHSALQSDDGHWLFFASDRPGGCGGLDLYVSYRKNVKDDMAWEEPRNLGCQQDGGPNGPGIDSCPNYDGKGNLYFTSAIDGNPGNLDYKVTKFDKKTRKGGVATTLSNSTPFMDGHIDAKHGYVWVGYPTGSGGSDIWQFENGTTERDPAKWVNPQPLPAPINTAGEDQMPASTNDGKILTFVSIRPGGKGGMDIYEAVRINEKRTSTINPFSR